MAWIAEPLQRSAIAFDVLAASRATAQDIAGRQRSRLMRLIDAAREGSALYRRRLSGIKRSDPLQTLVPVGKAELMHHFADWVTDPRLHLADLQAFVADETRIGELFLGHYTVWESSGTSGEPGIFVQDEAAMAVYDALEALRRNSPRPWQRALDPMLMTERIAFVGATGGHFASRVSMERLRRSQPWMASGWRVFSIQQGTASLVDELNRFAPSIVATYPTAAVLLADEAERGTLGIHPREVWTGGETLDAAMRQHVQRVFGCAVRNSYGASEFLPIAWECSHGRLHLNSDWLILEPVDENHRPVPAGEASYTTLLTNLANHLQPLIRYDLGDELTMFDAPCPCGCALPVVEVRGRSDDMLRMAGQDGRTVTLLPLALTTLLEEEAGVFDFQLLQRDARSLELHLVLPPEEAPAARSRCRHVLTDFIREQGLAPIHLAVHTGQLPVRGRSGKLKRVIVMPPPGPTEHRH
jgi:phenylacetate-coenzyme A ligase PaaK-like adenylate-forming protein